MSNSNKVLNRSNGAVGANDANGGHDHDKAEDGPIFSVNSIYVKDVSFEAPRVPHVFNEEWQPKLDFDLQMASNVLSEEEGIYEVALHLTVTVTLKDKPAFLIEVKQAGVFTALGFEPQDLKQILSTACPTVLFPYARETISNLVQRGGFPQLILPPINFDAMYAEQANSENTEPAMV